MGAIYGTGNNKGPKKFKNMCFGGITNDPLACITSNKEFSRHTQV